jgi:hypothetical protein
MHTRVSKKHSTQLGLFTLCVLIYCLFLSSLVYNISVKNMGLGSIILINSNNLENLI